MPTTCADFGGETADGKPCQRPRNDGRCPDHSEEAAERVKRAKKGVLEALEAHPEMNLEKALATYSEEEGVDLPSRVTVWRWGQEDSEFARQLSEAKDARSVRRLEMVEDSLIEKVLAWEASAALEIFILHNLARQVGEPKRWQDVRRIDVGAVEGKIHVGAARRLLDDVPDRVPEPEPKRLEPSENGAG